MKITERTTAFEALTIHELTFNFKTAIQHGKNIQGQAQDAKIAAEVKDIFPVKLEF